MFHLLYRQRYTPFIIIAALSAAGGVAAQDAYIGQIGDGNLAANVDLAGAGSQIISQIGNRNRSTQISDNGTNMMVSAQLGDRNANVTRVAGNKNTVAAAQIGFHNTAGATITGNANTVGTLQLGGLNSSHVTLTGNNVGVAVVQTGFGLHSNLEIEDHMGSSGLRATPMKPLMIGVNQSPGDTPVNAYISRDANNLTIRPGTATTVLRILE
jgi:hypothetical protein